MGSAETIVKSPLICVPATVNRKDRFPHGIAPNMERVVKAILDLAAKLKWARDFPGHPRADACRHPRCEAIAADVPARAGLIHGVRYIVMTIDGLRHPIIRYDSADRGRFAMQPTTHCVSPGELGPQSVACPGEGVCCERQRDRLQLTGPARRPTGAHVLLVQAYSVVSLRSGNPRTHLQAYRGVCMQLRTREPRLGHNSAWFRMARTIPSNMAGALRQV